MNHHVIGSAIETLVNELNSYFQPSTDMVVAANLLTQTGAITSGINGNIVLSLVNLEEDRISRPLKNFRQLPNGQVEKVNPEVRLNLYLLFIAHTASDTAGDHFFTSLGNLSRVIAFFQTKNYFDRHNTPTLDPRIDKLIMDTYTLTFEQQNHLWGALGAKYMPSVMYRARLVRIQEEEVLSEGPPITTLHLNAQDNNL